MVNSDLRHIVETLKKVAFELDTLAMDIELSICPECGGKCEIMEETVRDEVHNIKECLNKGCGFKERI